MTDLNRMFFRIEKFIAVFILFSFMKFDINQWEFWLILFMYCFVMDKFEDSIRREYDDTIRGRLERLMKEKYDE